jgi:uncharacterized protein with FMN-binding domain
MRSIGKSIAGLMLCACMVAGFGACTSMQGGAEAEYTASAPGNNGDVTVVVKVQGKRITQVKVVKQSETAGIADAAIARIPAAIVKGQPLAVDTVSGATHSSKTILEATEKCLAQAGFDVAALKAKKGEAKASAAAAARASRRPPRSFSSRRWAPWAATPSSAAASTTAPTPRCRSPTGATGDGIVMADAIGADLVDMEQIQLLYLGNPKNGSMTRYTPRCLSGTDKIIFVNKEGKRFVREDGRRDEICCALLKQAGKIMYIVESGDGDDVVPLDKMMTADGVPVRQAEADGDLFTSDTIEGLAAKIGCDPAALKASVEAFNASVASKKDEFGRLLYSIPMTKGPYIATPRVACVHHTMGGIRIDTKCEVLNKSGTVIPGLFAAGEVTGGIHGSNRLGGNAVVDTVVFGKLAGESATK